LKEARLRSKFILSYVPTEKIDELIREKREERGLPPPG
jgi:hypothetical protein